MQASSFMGKFSGESHVIILLCYAMNVIGLSLFIGKRNHAVSGRKILALSVNTSSKHSKV